ncbi:MAG: C-factor [Verrucomicrobia subdivision 3 bacterium]|nr:C-factor [Limisphaerales bacterium]MCS1414640.1 C-factor [Limisphaerales bacterium]
MKSVLITGANRGIGLETAKQLAAKGWRVFATSRRDPFPAEPEAMLLRENPTTEFLSLDVDDPETIQLAADTLSEKIASLDLLINNAGVLLDWNDSILNVTDSVLQQTFKTNTVGPVLVTRAFVPLLKHAATPLVINVSSAAGCLQDMKNWAPAYSISKTALNAATRQLAAALKSESIAVCCFSPGWVRTDMGGASATRSVQEGAQSIVDLLNQPPQTVTGRFLRDSEDIPW